MPARARAPGSRPPRIGPADRRAAEEHDGLEREHPPAHLGRGPHLHDRGRRGQEGDARPADERCRSGTRARGSASRPGAASSRRTPMLATMMWRTVISVRRAVESAPMSEPTLTTENSDGERRVVAVERALHEQRHDDLEVEGERADDRHHHERHPQLGDPLHVARARRAPALAALGDAATGAARPGASSRGRRSPRRSERPSSANAHE